MSEPFLQIAAALGAAWLAGGLIELKGLVAARSDRGLDDLATALLAVDGLTEFQLNRISK